EVAEFVVVALRHTTQRVRDGLELTVGAVGDLGAVTVRVDRGHEPVAGAVLVSPDRAGGVFGGRQQAGFGIGQARGVARWADGFGDLSGCVAHKPGGVTVGVGDRYEVSVGVIGQRYGHAFGINDAGQQSVVPGQLAAATHRVDNDRWVAVHHGSVFVFEDTTRSGHHGCDPIVFVVAISDIGALGG